MTSTLPKPTALTWSVYCHFCFICGKLSLSGTKLSQSHCLSVWNKLQAELEVLEKKRPKSSPRGPLPPTQGNEADAAEIANVVVDKVVE